MQTLTRIAVAAIGTTLTAGALVLSPAVAQDIDAGGIELWGNTAGSFSQVDGPFKAMSSGPGTSGARDVLAIGLDDKLVALPGTRAAIKDAIPPAISSTTVRSVFAGGTRGAWAVTADGGVHKWGGAGGTSIPDQSWTPAQLGDEAVEVAGAGPGAYVRLDDGRAVLLDAFGVTPCADGGSPLTGVKQLAFPRGFLLENGRVVNGGATCDVTTLVAADPADPIVDINQYYATTASGKILDYATVGVPEAPNVPTGFAGKAIKAVRGDAGHSALLTNHGEIVVWRPSDGATPTSTFQVPAVLTGRAVLDLQGTYGGGVGFAALFADVANHVKPAITGNARVESTLTASEGDWLGEPTSLEYQWLAGAGETEISGADEDEFTPTAAQVGQTLKVRVTAKRGDQEVSVTSDPTAAVEEGVPPLTVQTPATVAGTPQSGQTLTATPATFSDAAATITNEWLVDGQPISQAGTELDLTDAHVGDPISFRSTAVRGDETVVSTSVATAAVTAAPAVASTTNVSAGWRAYGQAGLVNVTVSASKAVTGKVTLTGAGTQVKNVSGGKAWFVLPKNLPAKRYTLKATFTSTNAAVSGSARSVTFTVVKGKTARPAVKFTKKPTSKKSGKATVTVGTASGLAKASGKVTITLKGKGTKTVRGTVRNGKASVTLPKLKKGSYKVTVTYGGDSNYVAAKSKTYSLKIKK